MQSCSCWMNDCLDRSVTRGTWPLHSPDHTPLAFLWGNLKAILHHDVLTTLETMRQYIID
jgi:hypothetical protein